MIIMILFLVLSTILIIALAIYLNLKKKKTVNNFKEFSNKEKKNKKDKKARKTLINLLPIKIKDNIICSKNQYSQVIKLGNIDYNMLSNAEQESIENVLIQTALAIDYPIQFFSTTEYINTTKVISLLKENSTKNSKIQEYKDFLVDYLQDLMENRTISIVKNYAIITYLGTYTNAVEELNRKSLSFKSNLLRGKIVCEILEENELYNLIYRELNKNSALDISFLRKGEENIYVGKKQKRKEKNKCI